MLRNLLLQLNGRRATMTYTHVHTPESKFVSAYVTFDRRQIRLRLFIGGKVSRRTQEMKSHSWQLTGRNGTTGEENIGGIHQLELIN